MKKVIGTLLLFAFFSTGAALADEVLFSQQPWLGEYGHFFSLTTQSQIDISEDRSLIAFDRFQIDGKADVTGITWYGVEYEPIANATFYVVIHDSVNNLPGNLLASWAFDLSEVNETYYATPFESRDSYYIADGSSEYASHLTINQYGIALPEAFTLEGRTDYWLGIYADVDGEGYWGWCNDIPASISYPFDCGDAVRLEDYDPVTGTYTRHDSCWIMHYPCGVVGPADMAFELAGESVPEPGTIAMIVAGLAGLAGIVKARR